MGALAGAVGAVAGAAIGAAIVARYDISPAVSNISSCRRTSFLTAVETPFVVDNLSVNSLILPEGQASGN